MSPQNDRVVLEALEVIRRRLVESDAPDDGPILGELADAWWIEVGQYQLRAKTTKSILNRLLPHLSGFPALQLTSACAREYELARQIHGKQRCGPGPLRASSIDTELKLLHRILQWSSEREPPLIPYNPFAKWKPRKAEKRIGAVHHEEQLHRLCDECPIWVRACILALSYTGARVSVILNLQWSDVSLATGWIRTPPDSATKKRGKPRLMSPATAALMQLDRSTTYVFESPRRTKDGKPKPYEYTCLRRLWNQACKRAGILTADGKPVLHHLRHGFALRAFEEWGWSLKQVMDRGGWTTVQSVMRYGALTREHRDAAHEHADEIARKKWMEANSRHRRGPRSTKRGERTSDAQSNK